MARKKVEDNRKDDAILIPGCDRGNKDLNTASGETDISRQMTEDRTKALMVGVNHTRQ